MLSIVRRSVWLCLILAVFLNGCGRKEVPQAIVDDAVTPQIVDLRSGVVGNVLRLDFVLKGSAEGVGYEIDRTKVDPYCQCPGFWRRFYEQPALARQVNEETYRIINLKTDAVEFLFRIRAVDVAGNFGPWSKLIRAQAVDLRKK
ncbi:hypothetical protein D8Y20_10010 [Mariprofundus sp. EBB-1]|uniref:hypothetical protein n=1 Tax=Mariprofundus sp. EBB-1 TaxID=2650971 RepID=UPI000EF25277|nr:hypothetical protein [Mariprofundus sp. EBB-1]RLL51189.1 hypothetical protein D8Y20_10010 [Mariprofundus sp. EBB-1]